VRIIALAKEVNQRFSDINDFGILAGISTIRWFGGEGSDEKNGRHEETRTPDLYRVKVAL
jgi:hypothetical protein